MHIMYKLHNCVSIAARTWTKKNAATTRRVSRRWITRACARFRRVANAAPLWGALAIDMYVYLCVYIFHYYTARRQHTGGGKCASTAHDKKKKPPQ